MEYVKHPLDPHTWPRDITPLGEKGEAGYLMTFPDMPGCVVIGKNPGDAFGRGMEKAREWLRHVHRIETMLSIKTGVCHYPRSRLIAKSVFQLLYS